MGHRHSAATKAKISASLKLYHRNHGHKKAQAKYKAHPTKANARRYDASARGVERAFKAKWAGMPRAMTEKEYLKASARARGAGTRKTFNDNFNE